MLTITQVIVAVALLERGCNLSNVSGTKWTRRHTVNISNQLNSQKTINFLQEQVFDLGSNILKQHIDVCQVQFNPTQSFNLLDESDQPTGQTMTHQQLYQAINSLYVDTKTANL